MTKKLHTKLFLPVFLVLLAFPIFIWTTFSATARQYFQQLAERKNIYPDDQH